LRIAEFSESSNFRTHTALPGIPGSMFSSVSPCNKLSCVLDWTFWLLHMESRSSLGVRRLTFFVDQKGLQYFVWFGHFVFAIFFISSPALVRLSFALCRCAGPRVWKHKYKSC